MTRVPITGIGVIAPSAVGVDSFASLLERGTSAAAVVDRFDTAGLRSHTAALVRDFAPRDFIAPMKLRRMNVLSRYAVAAARLAIDDSNSAADPASGVALGTVFGPVQTSVDYMREYVEKGSSLAPPQLFAESVANAAGSHVAIEFGMRGFNVTFTQRESSALAALMYGASQIVKGGVPSALVGGVEEVNDVIFSVLDSIGALAHACAESDERARPFDRRRNGMVIGEGGAAMMLATSPKREPYAWAAGFGIGRDITATISDWGSGSAAVAAAMRAAIDDAGIQPRDVDAVYASANSTVRADRLEMRAIESVFDPIPPVVAVKGCFGEYAAAGALQLVAAVLAIRNQRLHPSPGFEQPDNGARFTPTRSATPRVLRNVLVNSLSAGGGIVCGVLSRDAA